MLKLFSGILADRIGKHKKLALLGYGMGAIAQIILALSFSWPSVLFARLTDRVGKGIRATPRDLLIIHNSRSDQRSSAFGLHHSLESVGEIIGPLLAALLLLKLALDYRWIFAIALIPSVAGLVLLARYVPSLRQSSGDRNTGPVAFQWQDTSRSYIQFLIAIVLFSLGNSSDAFLMLRIKDLGYSPLYILLMYALFNLIKMLFSYPAGKAADIINPYWMLVSGYGLFAVVYLAFASERAAPFVIPLIILYGLYTAFSKGNEKSYLTSLINPKQCGVRMGEVKMFQGLASLPASIIAGWLYTSFSPSVSFVVSASLGLLSILVLLSIEIPKRV